MRLKAVKANLLEGSYTVEAAFLVPIILGIFFAWLFQLFYFHDTVIIDGMLMETVVHQEEAYRGKGDEVEFEKGRVQKQIQRHLWLMDIRSIREKKGVAGAEYILWSEATWNIPVMKYFLGNHFTYKKSIKIKYFHPESLLRAKKDVE